MAPMCRSRSGRRDIIAVAVEQPETTLPRWPGGAGSGDTRARATSDCVSCTCARVAARQTVRSAARSPDLTSGSEKAAVVFLFTGKRQSRFPSPLLSLPTVRSDAVNVPDAKQGCMVAS